jgi:hypothetical protein
MFPAATLLAGTGVWTTGAIALTGVAGAAAVASRRALRVHPLDGEARVLWVEATLRWRADFRSLARGVGIVALLALVAGFFGALGAGGRSGVVPFAAGVAVGLAALEVAAALERATRARRPAAAAGARSAVLLVAALQAGAIAVVGVVFRDPISSWSFAAGTLLVAWFAEAGRAASPAAARLAGMVSVQAFALAATGSLVDADLAAAARMLVACGAALPWIVKTHGADGLELGPGRRLLVPLAALGGVALLLALFIPRGEASAGTFAVLLAQLAGLALAASAARVGAHRARPRLMPAELAPALFLPLLAVAAALVVAAAAAGAAGIALATAAAAALLPALTLDGFAADAAAAASPADPDGAVADGARAASSAVVVLAGWAALRSASGPLAAVDLRDPAAAGGAMVGVLVALFAAALWRRGAAGESSRSTETGPRAMIVPAVLSAAVPWCAARLDVAAGGGIAAGVLLGGGTAAFLAPLSAAAPLERIVQLTGVVLAFCSK